MRILVTGSSGNLGRRVVSVAREMGHEVVPVDVRQPPEVHDGDTRIVDLSRIEGLPKLFEGIDAICHLGNLPGFSEVGRSVGFLNNTSTNYNVFLAADQVGIQRIVYASSVQSYGCLSGASGSPHPNVCSAPLYLPLDEDHPLLPCDAYPMSKAAGEWIAESFCRQRPDRTVWSLRFTGIRDGQRRVRHRPPNWQPPLGGSLYTWIHVEDASRAAVLALQTERKGHTPVNIVAPTSARPWSIELLTEMYGRLPDFRRQIGPDEALISGERAAALLEFRPAHTLESLRSESAPEVLGTVATA